MLELSKSVFFILFYGWVSSEVEVVNMFTRVSRTYGSTFIALLFLSYFTQGLRCFPLLAITYHLKDYLKVKKKCCKISPALLFLVGCFQVHSKSRREANLCLLTKLPHDVSTRKESCLQQTTSQS